MADEQNSETQNDQVSQDLSLSFQGRTKEDYQALILALQKGKDELEAEKAKSQEAVVLHEGLTDRLASLEADLAVLHEKDTQAESQTQELILALQKGKDELESAVGAYKDVVLKANPLIPTDMIQGLTIDEVNASLEKATALVGHIKEGLEKEGNVLQQKDNADKIPPGAPQRTGPDLSSMTTKEKINYGLREAQKGD